MGPWNAGVIEYGLEKKAQCHYSIATPLRYPGKLAMANAGLLEELRRIAGLKVKTDEPLGRYTSMKIGGPADYFLQVQDDVALRQLLPLLKRDGATVYVLGNGSNVLVSDSGVRGAILHLAGDFSRAEWREDESGMSAVVGAAYPVTRLVREAVRRGYAGLEFAEGIPGSMGGALVMNAGAYGSEFEKIVDQVEGVTAAGEGVCLQRSQLRFSYRESNLPSGMVVTRVRLRLTKEDAAQLSAKLRELVARRKASQPSGRPNCGSMFRNPAGDYAGRLIEAAGLKGKRIGQAQISERHGNFIINLGGATAEDVRQLMDFAKTEVKRRFDIELLPEVRVIGER
jgi:UDP-N-acetylmuramate dehydrogenase